MPVKSRMPIVSVILLSLIVSFPLTYGANSTRPASDQQDSASNRALNQSLIGLSEENTDAENATKFINWGNYWFKYNHINWSLLYYNESIAADPYIAESWNNKGVALIHFGQYEEAIKCYDEAANLDPSNEIIWSNKGEAEFRLGKFSDALICLDQSLRLKPENAPAWTIKGVILARQGKHQEALECMDKSLRKDYSDSNSWLNKGVILARMNDYDNALSCFCNAASLDQNSTEAWVDGALAQMALGNAAKSNEALARARLLGYNNTKVHDYLMRSEPKLLEVSKRKAMGFEGALALGGFSVMRCILIRKKQNVFLRQNNYSIR